MNEPVPSGAVVVGIDGSDHSHRALDAACDVAAREHRPLHVLHCYEPYPAAMGPVLPSRDVTSTLRGIAESVVQEARERVAERHPTLTVSTSLSTHDAREKLSAVSHQASLLVVGSRGRGGMRSLLLGSTSLWVAHHSACPVLVVRPEPDRAPGTDAAAGGDAGAGTSDGARARRRGRSRRQRPLTGGRRVRPSPRRRCGGSPSAWCTACRRCPTATTPTCPWTRTSTTSSCTGSSCRRRSPGLREKYPDVDVELTLARGPAAGHLVEESRHSRLLVVGAHHRSVWDLFLGSVSRAVVEHAACPGDRGAGRPSLIRTRLTGAGPTRTRWSRSGPRPRAASCRRPARSR